MAGGGLALFIYAIWSYNFLFAVIIIIIATIIFIHEKREPEPLPFSITYKGITLADDFIPYKNIKKFWIVYEPPEIKKLYFQLDRKLRAELSVPLLNMNPVYIRQILLKYLPEDLEQKNPSTDDLLEKMFKI